MPSTHLMFFQPCTCGTCEGLHQLEIVLPGTPALSPLVEINGVSFALYASYTHSDGTVDNAYHPLLTTDDCHC